MTPGSAWDKPIVVTVPTSMAVYVLGASSVTFAAGSTTAQTTTMTAVNNFTDVANNAITLTLTADSPWVTIGAAPTVTINDDDELTKPTGVKLSVDGTKIRVDWTAVTGATGYKVQWNTSDAWTSPSEGTVSSGSTTTYTINPTPALTANTRYYVRVLPTKTGADEPPSDVVDTTTHATSPATVDYDADNDGLIEVSNLAQLNAVRWDLDGNGVVDDATNQSSYDTAFPNAEDNMGCNESAVSIASNNTGNPACTGYELRANLDFDTGTAGDRTDDTYYNSGAGWTPIGDDTTAYTGDFDGNSDTDASGDGGPYTITNLHVNLSSTSGLSYAGLFGVVGAGAEVENVALTGVSVTGSTTADAVYAGALAGRNQGTVTGSHSLGAVTANRTGTDTDKKAYAGGLVGQNSGTIRASYSRATVTATAHDANEGYAGGLVGINDSGATIAASYAAGDVTANKGTDTGTANNDVFAGGLVGKNDGTITASYARGDATASGKNVDAGGLVGTMTLATVTASFSTGSVTATITGGTETTGGLIGSAPPSATITDSYWDTQTSGVTETGYGTGKTTSELQTPTSETGIYVNWDVNVDGVTGNDDPWDFGTAGQYPVLDFGGHTVNDQRATVNVTLSPTTICESAAGTDTNACGANPVTSATLTVTPAAAWHDAITVTMPANAAVYTLKVGNTAASSLTFTAGSTTAQTITVDAVNNKTDAADASVTFTATTGDAWVSVSATPSLTIKDDDLLAKPTGVKVAVDGAKARVDWTAVTDATGYTVQWSTSSTFTGTPSSAAVTGQSTTNHSITTGLTSGTEYHFRVIATVTGYDDSAPSDHVSATPTTGNVDYDADNDGLIEVSNLAQLNAIRYDLDGNGQVASGDQTNYDTAFPNAEDNMGCNESAVSIASNDTGNPPCTGYELRANLDFDTNSDGTINASDYVDLNGNNTKDTGEDAIIWNSSAGWDPIGGVSGSTYTGNFDGGTYTISNLFIDRSSGSYAGLFAYLDGGSGTTVKNVSLVNVDVTLNTSTGSSVHVGGLAGRVGNGGVGIEDSYTTGRVRAGESASEPVTLTASPGYSYVGGLVGRARAAITGSYSLADVTSNTKSASASPNALVGGLVGEVRTSGSVSASYAAGDVTANIVGQNNNFVYAGGLVGQLEGSITASYARGAVTADSDATVTTGITGNAAAGGLVGATPSGSSITASFSTGAPTATGDGQVVRARGLVGFVFATATVTNSYWDTDTSGVTDTGAGTGKTTSELQTPTAYGTGSNDIYKDWNLNLDGVTGNDDPWSFGTASQYPVLKYGGQTASQQRVTVTLTASPATIWERALTTPARVNATTLTATAGSAWDKQIVVTLPASAAVYTLGAATVTIPAGSTAGVTATLTAVNNRVDAANNAITLAITADSPWVTIGTAPTVTINDDDSLAAPTGGSAFTPGNVPTTISVQWLPVTNAAGYKIQYKLTTVTTWGSEVTVPTSNCTGSGGNVRCKRDFTSGFTVGSLYDFRIWATSAANSGIDDGPYAAFTGGPGVDYDTDDDGLLEITSLAQLNAVRHDLNGDGAPETGSTVYNAAFPSSKDKMGCQETVTLPVNRTCLGYELRANLDFDSDNDGDVDANDHSGLYWNSGAGWDPIGSTSGTAYTGYFDGNSDTDASGDGGPYVISNLFMNWTSGNYAGLFAHLQPTGNVDVSNMAIENADVTLNIATDVIADVHVGILAGRSEADISRSYTTGSVKAVAKITAASTSLYVGGLVGLVRGADVTSSYSWADVEGDVLTATHSDAAAYAGGLAGVIGEVSVNTATNVIAGFAAGDVTAKANATGTAYAGGLAGLISTGAAVKASYARGDVHGGAATAASNYRGALAGHLKGATSQIAASFATGALTGAASSGRCGIVGHREGTSTINDSYYNSDTLGQTSCSVNNGTGKTTSELQTPTAYGTGSAVYADWNLDIVGTGNIADDPWSFGTASQYPVVKHGFGDSASIEKQRPEVTFSVTPITIYEAVGGATSATLTATLTSAWNVPVVVDVTGLTNCMAPGTSSTDLALKFTTTNYSTAQSVTVKLAANPNASVTIRLDAPGVVFSPTSLTFNATTWNTAQSVSVNLAAAPTGDTFVHLDTFCERFRLSAPAVTVAVGDTTGSVTLTALNNKDDDGNLAMTLSTSAHAAPGNWIARTSTIFPFTVTDDDELAKTTGVTAAELSGDIKVDWTAVTGATGYVIEWKSGSQDYDSTRQVAVSGGSTVTGNIPEGKLASNTTYTVRVYATKANVDTGAASDEATVAYVGGAGRNFVFAVQPADKTLLWGDGPAENPFPDTSHTTLYQVEIVTLPPSAQGTLKVLNRGRWVGRPQCRINPNHSWCRVTYTDVTAGQKLFNPARANNSPSLFFFPSDSFSDETQFTYRTIVRTVISDPSTEQAPSATSTVTLFKPANYTPTTPTNLTATRTGMDSVTLNWTALSATDTDNAEANRHAIIQVAYKMNNGAYTPWGKTNKNKDSTSHTVLKIEPGAAYTFKIRANNWLVYSAESNEAIVRMTPSAPTGFTITPGTGQMGLSWTASTDSTIAKYQYRRVDKDGALRARPGNAQIELVWDAPDTGGLGVYKWQYQVQRIAAADMLGAIPSDSGATLWWKDPAVPTGKTVASWQYRDKVNTCPVCGWITTYIPGGADVRSHVVGNYNNGSQMAVQLRPKYTDNSYGSWSNTVVFTVGQSGSRWTDIPNSDDGTRSYVIPSLTNGDTYRLQVRGLSLRVLGHESVHPPYTAAVAVPSATVSDGWTDLPAIAATQTTSLTFTTLNWSTAQSASIKLNAAPTADVTVGLYQDGVVFTPSRLTFTTTDYGTAQSVSVALASAPAASVTVNVTAVHPIVSSHNVTGLKNGVVYSFQARAVSAAGAGPATPWRSSPVLPPKPTGLTATAGDGQAALTWNAIAGATLRKWEYSKDGGTNWADVPADGTFYWRSRYNANETYWEYRQTQPVASVAGGLTAVGNAGDVRLYWNPVDNEADAWQYRLRRSSASGWTNETWEPVLGSTGTTRSYTAPAIAASQTIGLVQTTGLTFTTLNWNTAQTAQIALSAQPTAGVTVKLEEDGVTFTPSTLTFTTGNHSTTQPVQVKLTAAPTQDRTVKVTLAREVGTSLAWQVRPLNSSGAVIGSPISGTATAGNDGNVDLSWTFTNTNAIAKWQYRHKTSGDWTSVTWTDVPGGKGAVTYTVPSLTADTEYTFQVRAVNSAGTIVGGILGGTAGVTATPTTLPAWQRVHGSSAATRSHTVGGLDPDLSYAYQVRPVIQVVPNANLSPYTSSGAASVTVSWSAYTWKTGATGWEARKRTTDGPWGAWETVSGDASATTHTFTGLNTGLSYQFQVRRTNAFQRAALDGGTAVKSFPASVTVTGLTNGTAYTFKVRAVTAAGDGTASDGAAATPVTSLLAPVLSAVGLGDSVRLDWTISSAGNATGWEYRQAEPADDGLTAFPADKSVDLLWATPASTTGIAKWQYRHKSGGGDFPATWTDVTGSSATTTSAVVGSLTNATAYTFQVRAVNSSDAIVGTALGDAAATPSATPWTSVSGAATRTATVTSLTETTRYAFQVRAVNSIGPGPVSNVAATYAAARPAKPTGLAATSGGHRTTTLSWPTANTASKWQVRARQPGPAGMVIGSGLPERVTLSWDTVSLYGQWQYRQGTVSSGGAVSWGQWTDFLCANRCGSTTLTLTLANDTLYTYQVSKRLQGVRHHGAERPGVAAPQEPCVRHGAAQDVVLDWTNPGSSGTTKWQYRKGAVSGSTTTWDAAWTDIPCTGDCSPLTMSSHTITTSSSVLTTGSVHVYQVRSEGSSNNYHYPSDLSVWHTFGTPPTVESNHTYAVTGPDQRAAPHLRGARAERPRRAGRGLGRRDGDAPGARAHRPHPRGGRRHPDRHVGRPEQQ